MFIKVIITLNSQFPTFNSRLYYNLLTSSSCHPKIFVKEFGDFLMPCHQHCLGVKMESVNRFMLLLLL